MTKCEWRSDWDEDYRCRVAAEKGSKFCIFHEPGEKDIQRFKQAFYSQIREEGSADERNEQYDFRGYVFPTGLTVRGEEAELILPREIRGSLIMVESTIEGNADFWGATIEENADFLDATIEGNADFTVATIEGCADFTGATIKGHAEFGGTTIKGYADFRGTTIEGYADFMGVTIEEAYFWAATFKGEVSFSGARIAHLLLAPGRPTILWWARNREGVTLKNWATGSSFWAFARRTFTEMDERERADAAFYFEKVWQRRSRLASSGRERLMAILGYPFELLLLRLPIAYGTSLVRPLMSWFVFIVLFGGLYAGFPSLIGRTVKSVWTLSNWVISLHFSVTSFTTLGLGDIRPDRLLGKALTSIEAVVGGVLMALTVVVISRKLMR